MPWPSQVHGWRFANANTQTQRHPRAARVGCEKGGIDMQGGEGEAQGNQSFKLIVTRYLVVAEKRGSKTDG